MPNTKKVALYGGSLFIVCLEVSLTAVPDLQVQFNEERAENSLEQVQLAAPDVIIFELGPTTENLTITLLQKFPDVILIGLDPESDRLLILSVQQQQAIATADLVNVILAQHPSRKE